MSVVLEMWGLSIHLEAAVSSQASFVEPQPYSKTANDADDKSNENVTSLG